MARTLRESWSSPVCSRVTEEPRQSRTASSCSSYARLERQQVHRPALVRGANIHSLLLFPAWYCCSVHLRRSGISFHRNITLLEGHWRKGRVKSMSGLSLELVSSSLVGSSSTANKRANPKFRRSARCAPKPFPLFFVSAWHSCSGRSGVRLRNLGLRACPGFCPRSFPHELAVAAASQGVGGSLRGPDRPAGHPLKAA